MVPAKKVLDNHISVLKNLPGAEDIWLGYRADKMCVMISAREGNVPELRRRISELGGKVGELPLVIHRLREFKGGRAPWNPFLPLIQKYGSIEKVQALEDIGSEVLKAHLSSFSGRRGGGTPSFLDLFDPEVSPIYRPYQPNSKGGSGGEHLYMGIYKSKGVSVFDPVQGGLSDCGLIASLASLAWVCPDLIKGAEVDDDGGYHYRHGFFEAGDRSEVVTNNTVFVDPEGENDHLPRFAYSYTGKEFWPSLFEKGCALFVAHKNRCDPDEMDYGLLEMWKEPRKYLQRLTGWDSISEDWSGADDDSVADILKGACQNDADIMAVDGGADMSRVIRKTRNPMITWTASGYDGEAERDQGRYKIAPSHAYSLLGYIAPGDGMVHALIRDPFGAKETSEGTATQSKDEFYYYDLVSKERGSIVFKKNDGMFTLPLPSFGRLFSQAVGVRMDTPPVV